MGGHVDWFRHRRRRLRGTSPTLPGTIIDEQAQLSMKTLHKCRRLEMGEGSITEDAERVMLNINRLATEDDLERNHNLEEIGQIIDYISVPIRYCPYCGELLDAEPADWPPSFEYRDISEG